MFQPRRLMTVGEMSSTRLEHCQRYAALGGDELSMTFNFHHLKVDYLNGEKWSLMPPNRVELKHILISGSKDAQPSMERTILV